MTLKKVNQLPKREEIDAQYKWKLEDIYPDNESWEKDFKKTKELLPSFVSYKGRLSENSAVLLEALKLSEEISMLTEKLYVYARMRRDEDNTNTLYQALTDRASSLSVEVSGAMSFFIPEIISIPENIINKYINEDSNFAIYKHYFDEIFRQKKHILSDKEESILALSGEISSAAKDIFGMINNADIKFPVIQSENGEEIELTKGNFIKLMQSSNRQVRREAFLALYGTYAKQKNTLASTLNANVKKNIFYTKVRNYSSALERALDADNISTSVYDTLIDTVNQHLHLLHRYVSLRKKALKLEELHMYDLYNPLVNEMNKHIYYKDSLKIVEEALKPLGTQYIGALREGFESGWIDVYENEGKTSGAYSWGCYSTHPYVLLNYQGTMNDTFTLAHEMGHALHSYFTNKTQPYVYSQYKIFVAEVASTVNESLLMQHLLKTTSDRNEKAYLLNHYLDEFRGTVFRQVMFAEFEKIIHQKVENGEALTAQLLCDIYYDLNVKYYGNNMVIDKEIAMEWSRIPHFYTSFYVYKYATGFSAAIALSRHILEEGQPAVNRYMQFLKSGDSDYPIELLKKAGVDLSSPQPVMDALKVFEETLDEFERMLV